MSAFEKLIAAAVDRALAAAHTVVVPEEIASKLMPSLVAAVQREIKSESRFGPPDSDGIRKLKPECEARLRALRRDMRPAKSCKKAPRPQRAKSSRSAKESKC